MKYCSVCSQCLPDDATACPVCGHSADDATQVQREVYDAEKYTHSAVRRVSGRPKLTVWLIGINVAVFIIIRLAMLKGIELTPLLTMHRGAVVGGQYWRLLTSMFTHEELFHLASNCYALYIYGLILERGIGRGRFAAVYFSGGLLGNLLSFAFMQNPSIGASGAVFGLLGAVIAIHFINPTAMSRSMAANVFFSVAVTTFYSIGGSINNLAHFGGLFGGYIMLCLTVRQRVRPRLITARPLMAVVLAVITAGSVFFGATARLNDYEMGYGDYSLMCFYAETDNLEAAYGHAVALTEAPESYYTADALAVRVLYEYSISSPEAPRSMVWLNTVNDSIPLMNEAIYERIVEFTNDN